MSDSVEVILTRAVGIWSGITTEISEVAEKLRGSVGDQTFDRLLPDFSTRVEQMQQAMEQFEEAVSAPRVVIATTGTTSAGKSTLANLLIGDVLLPKAVQEMSAGVVEVKHSPDKRSLKISSTRGATWTTGEWRDISADEIRRRLKDTMEVYRKRIDGQGSRLDAPRFEITWPTRLGQSPDRFGIPSNARISLLDLPGLKFIDDDINGHVVREQSKKALCIVAYNANETDPHKQDALLRQVVDQVKSLGGSPARMLFVLNKIDVFQKDDGPKESEQAFSDRVTTQIRHRLLEALPEYESEVMSILPVPLSSEPALYGVLAARTTGEAQIEHLDSLEREYRIFFKKEDLKGFPRDHEEWSEWQRGWFLDQARQKSRVKEFEQHLREHIASKLPEILLPDLVDGVYQPSREAVMSFDALVEAYSREESEELKEAIDTLDQFYARLKKLQKQAINPLDPLREIATGDSDLVEKLLTALPEVEERLMQAGVELPEGRLDPLRSAVVDSVQVPLQTLNDHVFKVMEGTAVEDPIITACPSSTALYKAITELQQSPYGDGWRTGGKYKAYQAEKVRDALDSFAKALARVATELIDRESQKQADRMSQALQSCGLAIAEKLESDVCPIREEMGYNGLQGIFRGSFTVPPPRLPGVRFSSTIKEWSHTKEIQREEKYYEKKRVWWKLWLGKKKVEKTRVVTSTHEESGIEVAKLASVLEGFISSGNVDELDRFFADWMSDSITSFDDSLSERLKEGVKVYRVALEQRREELQQNTEKKIGNVSMHNEHISEVLRSLEKNHKWRSYV